MEYYQSVNTLIWQTVPNRIFNLSMYITGLQTFKVGISKSRTGETLTNKQTLFLSTLNKRINLTQGYII